MNMIAALRSSSFALFLLIFFGHAYFSGWSSWNQNARLDSIRSFVEPGQPDSGTLRIDHYIVGDSKNRNTEDWAQSEAGHYYSNKAPGPILLGIPIYFLLYHFEKSRGLDPSAPRLKSLNDYFINLWVTVFWTALAGAVLFLGYRAMGQPSPRDALAAVWVYAFATLIFPFDVSVWGHATAAALLALCYGLLFSSRDRTRLVIAGLCLGGAVLVEYHSAPSLPLAFIYLLWRDRSWRNLPWLVAGAFLPLALLLILQKVCLGGFLVTFNSRNNPMFASLNGWTAPSLRRLWELLFGLKRGLFIYMPVLAFSLLNLNSKTTRLKERVLCWAHVFLYLLVISSYVGWHGGATAGPRYLISSLPFWCLLLPAFTGKPRWFRVAWFVAAFISFLNMFVIVSTTSVVGEDLENPLFGKLYPDFFHGRLGISPADLSMFNLGSLSGLSGIATVIPFVVLLAGASLWLWRRIGETGDA